MTIGPMHPHEYERVKLRAEADGVGFHEAYVRICVDAIHASELEAAREHDPMCTVVASYVTLGTPPAPHNCPFCKVSLPARAAERERIRTWCMEAEHKDGCACDVIDTLNRIDARGGDKGTGGRSVLQCGVCKRELAWMGVELDGSDSRLHHADDLSAICVGSDAT